MIKGYMTMIKKNILNLKKKTKGLYKRKNKQ